MTFLEAEPMEKFDTNVLSVDIGETVKYEQSTLSSYYLEYRSG